MPLLDGRSTFNKKSLKRMPTLDGRGGVGVDGGGGNELWTRVGQDS